MPNTMGLTIKIPGKKSKYHHDDSEDKDNKPLINTNTSILSVIYNLLSRLKRCFIK